MSDIDLRVRLKATDDGYTAVIVGSDKKIKSLENTTDSYTKAVRANTSALKSLEKNLSSYSKGTDRAAASTNRLGQTAGRATGLLGALAGSLVLKSMYDTATQFERINAQLVTVTGNTRSAGAAFEQLQAFTQQTPFQLAEVTGAFVKLQNFGLKSGESALTSYGNTAAAMGRSLDQMVEAVADATTGEFERLKEFGIKTRVEGDKVKFTFRGVTTEIGNSAEEIEDYLMKIGNTEFAGAMEQQMDTIGGAVSNTKDIIQGLFITFSEAGAGEGFKNLILSINSALEQAAPAFEFLGEHAGTLLTTMLAFGAARFIGPMLNSLAASAFRGGQGIAFYARHLTVARARTIALATSANVLRGALAFLGGPAGLILLAGTALLTMASSSDDAVVSTAKLNSELVAMRDNLNQLPIDQVDQKFSEGAERLEELDAEILKVERRLAVYQARQERGMGSGRRYNDVIEQTRKKLKELREEKGQLTQSVRILGRTIDLSDFSNINNLTKPEIQERLNQATNGLATYNAMLNQTKRLYDAGIVDPSAVQELELVIEGLQKAVGIFENALDKGGSKADEQAQKFIDKLKEQLATVGKNSDEVLRYQASLAVAETQNQKLRNEITNTTEALIQKRNELERSKNLAKNDDLIQSLREEIEMVAWGNEQRFVETQLRKLAADATDEQALQVAKLARELYQLNQAENVEKTVSTVKSETKDMRLNATVSALELQSATAGGDYFAQQEAEVEAQRAIAMAQEQAAYDQQVQQREQSLQDNLLAVQGNLQAEQEIKAHHREQLELAEEIHANKLAQIQIEASNKLGKIEADRRKHQLQGVMGTLGNLSQLMQSHNEKAFKIGKAAAIAQTVVSTYQAAQKAYTAFAEFPPIAIAFAASAIAAGMARVQSIRSQQFRGQAHDGLDYIPQEGTYLLDRGERVIDRRTNYDLKEYLRNSDRANNSQQNNFNFEFNGDSSNRPDLEDFADMVTQRVLQNLSRDQRTRGSYTRQLQGA